MDALPQRVLSAPLLAAALLLLAAAASGRAPAVAGTAAACLSAPRVLAVEPCERALAEPDESPETRLEIERRLAGGLLATYRETDGVERLAALAARRPWDLRAQLDLAGALVGLRDYPAAEAPLARALQLAPEAVEVNRLAALYFTIVEDHDSAHQAHRRLAERGLLVAMFDLADDYAQGRGVEPDQRQARRWLERAASGGHVLAMRTLSEKLRYGAFGSPPEAELAERWLRRAQALQQP
jgi:TPR repeat protein